MFHLHDKTDPQGIQSWLPSGWNYDEKTNEFKLGATEDFWSVENGFLVRNHVVGRADSFTFDRDTLHSMPIPLDSLQRYKITMPDDSHGKIMLEAINTKEVKIGTEPWIGSTMFPLSKDAAAKFNQPFFSIDKKVKKAKRLSTKFDETTWLANLPTKKKKESEADLRESKMTLEDRLKFMEGKKAELISIFENDVWELEPNPDAVESLRIMKARFFLKWDNDGHGGLKAKARLVLQGFADPEFLSGEFDISSPTLNRSSRQVILILMSLLHWCAVTADVSTAFFEGDPQQRDLWARLPKDACNILGIPPGSLMRLIKPLYGQPDAPKAWYVVAKRKLESIGYVMHPLDGCLFRLFDENKTLISLMGIHVDNLLITGQENNRRFQQARDELRAQFSFKHWTPYEEGKPLEFCGCFLKKEDDAWILNQQEYIKKVHPLTVPIQCGEDSPAGPKEISALRGLLGGLQWPSTQTCPHLSASISLLCGETSKATIGTLRQANKTLKFAKENSDVSLRFPAVCKSEEAVMIAISDAAWGVRPDCQSQGGYMILLTHPKVLQGHEGEYIILDW